MFENDKCILQLLIKQNQKKTKSNNEENYSYYKARPERVFAPEPMNKKLLT